MIHSDNIIELHKNDIAADLEFGNSVAIDTETLGLNPMRDRLCLLQLSAGDGSAHLVQFDGTDYSAFNLKKLLRDQSITKIFHFARFDVTALAVGLGIEVKTIFCTKIASKVARTYTNKHGLKDVVLEIAGIELDKQQQCSDWGKSDELSDAQLSYASNDTRYLIQVKEELKRVLIREGRWELANKCFECIPTISKLDILNYKQIFEH